MPNHSCSHLLLGFTGSRFNTPAESRYAPIEGEALAVSDALDKYRMFVLGCPLNVVVDHDRSFEDIDKPRLLCLKERTLRHQFTMQHNAGNWHHTADAISHYSITDVKARAGLSVYCVYWSHQCFAVP